MIINILFLKEIPKKKQDSEDEYVAEEDEEEIAHDEVDEVDEIDEAEKDSESSGMKILFYYFFINIYDCLKILKLF